MNTQHSFGDGSFGFGVAGPPLWTEAFKVEWDL